MNHITTRDLCGALDNLKGAFADDDRMSATQEAYAEQAREYLDLAIERLTQLFEVIRLCRPYIMTDEHSEEADCDCDSMMDDILNADGVKRSEG